MLVHKNGDILEATENIICHQVNEDAIMGGGLALQIANRYPEVKKRYKTFCHHFYCDIEKLLGLSVIIPISQNQKIANCFTQDKFVTNLMAIRICFSRILRDIQKTGETIAIPFGYGCGIAKGNWKEVEKIFEELSQRYETDIVVYHYGQ